MGIRKYIWLTANPRLLRHVNWGCLSGKAIYGLCTMNELSEVISKARVESKMMEYTCRGQSKINRVSALISGGLPSWVCHFWGMVKFLGFGFKDIPLILYNIFLSNWARWIGFWFISYQNNSSVRQIISVKLWDKSWWPGQEAQWTMPAGYSLDAKMEH